MLLIEQTITKFGHDPSRLSAGSSKRVCIQCTDCQLPFDRKRADIRNPDNYQCRKCSSMRQVHKLAASSQVKSKRAKTTFEHFGVSNAAQIPSGKEKRKDTCIKKYGKEHFYQTEVWREQAQNKNLERYGKDWFFQTAECKVKTVDTCMQRYGQTSAMKDPLVQARQSASCQANLGVTNPSNSPEVVSKILQTKLTRYGTTSPTGIGQEEERIKQWLASIGVNAVKDHSIIPGKELDLFCKEAKVAIEYNGLYWHCEKFIKDRRSHANKWRACQQAGVRLITIFEDEWLHRQPQVKNFLQATFGKNTKVFARNCAVRAPQQKEVIDFLERTHIQGAPHTFTHAAGLYDKAGTLLGVMTFGKHHRGGKDTVLSRMSFAPGITVVGGSSKLFKFLLNTSAATKVVSWSDNRWSAGSVYPSLGFTLSAALPPDYSYVDTTKSTATRKSKQSNKKSLTGCPKNVKEFDWCRNSGLYRIWDCGKIRWEHPGLLKD